MFHDPWPPGHGRIYGNLLDELHEIGDCGAVLPMSLNYMLVPR